MSLWIKIVIGIVVFVAVLAVLMLYLTAGLTRAADGFFEAVAQKDMAKARSFLSEGFRSQVDEQALESFLVANSVAGFRSAHWTSRKVENGRGALSGSITTDTGGVVPISLELVKEHGAWKIYALSKPAAGLRPEEPRAAVEPPGGSVIFQLVKTSMNDFAVSLVQQDMSHFRSTLSPRWQDEISAEELGRIYGPFYDQARSLLALIAADPVPTASPKVLPNGAMVVEGYYPAGAKRLLFTHKYEKVGDAWKLIGFDVEIADAPAGAATSGTP